VTIRKIMSSDLMGKAVILSLSGSLLASPINYALKVIDTGRLKTSEQSQVYQARADAEERARPENVAYRLQLQHLVDVDGNNQVSLQEYDGFRKVTGRKPYFDKSLEEDLEGMNPNEVRNAIEKYRKMPE